MGRPRERAAYPMGYGGLEQCECDFYPNALKVKRAPEGGLVKELAHGTPPRVGW